MRANRKRVKEWLRQMDKEDYQDYLIPLYLRLMRRNTYTCIVSKE